jgi:hypothetical protein
MDKVGEQVTGLKKYTYYFVVLTSLTHQRKILFVVLQIAKAKNLSAPRRVKLPVCLY